ncbi:MAG: UDP-2,3-diacylglucosamine diphosphatase LpxI [Rhizobiaceae bacterium]
MAPRAMTAPTKGETPLAVTLPQGSVVALIAGGGSLPAEIAGRFAEAGQPYVVLAIEGEADDGDRFASHPVDPIALEDAGSLIARLKRRSATHVLMAGTVRRRPRLRDVRWNTGLFKVALDIAWALAHGDDRLLRAVIDHIEKHGIKVISVQDVLPDLLAAEGVVAGRKPGKRDMADIEAARTAVEAIGALDIGQAAIAVGGRVIALEGIEGTEGLLARTAELRHHGRLAGAAGGVLVKCAKPGQDLRADLPSIGPATIDAVAGAGLAGIAVEAGRSLILEREETIRRADDKGIFVFGLEAREP